MLLFILFANFCCWRFFVLFSFLVAVSFVYAVNKCFVLLLLVDIVCLLYCCCCCWCILCVCLHLYILFVRMFVCVSVGSIYRMWEFSTQHCNIFFKQFGSTKQIQNLAKILFFKKKKIEKPKNNVKIKKENFKKLLK